MVAAGTGLLLVSLFPPSSTPYSSPLCSVPQEADYHELHLPGFLALWLPIGFVQETLLGYLRAGGERSWLVYPPLHFFPASSLE